MFSSATSCCMPLPAGFWIGPLWWVTRWPCNLSGMPGAKRAGLQLSYVDGGTNMACPNALALEQHRTWTKEAKAADVSRRWQDTRQFTPSGGSYEMERLCDEGHLNRAMEILFLMDQESLVPSVQSYSNLLQACVKQKALVEAKRVQTHILRHGLSSNNFLMEAVANTLIKCGSILDGLEVFHQLPYRSAFSWTAVISGYSNSGLGHEALRMYKAMRQDGVQPNKYTFVSLLKACSILEDLQEGKMIHVEVLQSGYESDVFIGSSLVHMYATCGSIADAQDVFDRLSHRDVVSWNTMIEAYAEKEQSEEALQLYILMLEEGVKPDNRTFVGLFKSCRNKASMYCSEVVKQADDLGLLQQVRTLHAEVVRRGYERDPFAGSSLVNLYASIGNMIDAQHVFDRFSQGNVVLWTAIIAAYADQEQWHMALQLYDQMQEQGVKPNERTFVSLLKACATLGAEEAETNVHGKQVKVAALGMGRELHSFISVGVNELSVFLGTALVHMYANSGSIIDAQGVFQNLSERNVVTWTALLAAYAQDHCAEALEVYSQMLENGVLPNEWTFVNLLQSCASLAAAEEYATFHGMEIKLNSLHQGKIFHAEVSRAGYGSNPVIGNSLLHMYVSCASMADAQSLFNCLPHRSVVSWTTLISGYVQQDEGDRALALYFKMQEAGVSPNQRTFVCVLKACGRLASVDNFQHNILEKLKKLRVDIVKQGYELDVFVGSTLVHLYANCGSMVEAQGLFDKLPQRDVVAWTAIIAGYAQEGNGKEALRLYSKMQEEGVLPNARTFVSLLKACTSLGDMEDSVDAAEKSSEPACLQNGRLVHAEIIANGYNKEGFVGSTLVDLYLACGSIAEAREVFESMPVRDVGSWNAMISGHGQQDQANEALRLFARMQEEGVRPNEATFLCILDVCSTSGALQVTRQIHQHIIDRGLTSSVTLVNTLVHAYGKCGSMVDAQEQFDSLSRKDVVSWNALIAGYARSGHCEMSLQYFDEMQQAGVEPDPVTFVALLSACSHKGLLDRGLKFFQLMRHDYCMTPTAEHYVCMIDLLGRAGLFTEVEDLLLDMPVQPTLTVWLSLLGACRKHGNVELGRHAFEQAVMLDPRHCAAYMLMSNTYARAEMLEESMKVEELRRSAGAWKKQPGQSWIDYEEKVHTFMVGDISDRQGPEVHAWLADLCAAI